MAEARIIKSIVTRSGMRRFVESDGTTESVMRRLAEEDSGLDAGIGSGA